jgi:hypothetical protein
MKQILQIMTILFTMNLSAQVNFDNSTLQVVSFIENNRVLLRWAPKNSINWLLGNKIGYSVFRKVVMRNGIVIQSVDSILVGKYYPLPLQKWNPFSDSSYYAVAAEAIYGEGFEITAQSKTFFDFINKSKEQESRFSIGLLCADQSFTVACMMGLGLVDTTVKSNETYLYKVVMNTSETRNICGSGYAVVDFVYGNFTPRPFGFSSQVKDNIITVLVPFQPFKGVYKNFDVQRSEDGMRFLPIISKSHYSMSTSQDDPQYYVYVDSVSLKSKAIFYRIRGRTPFDTYGPFSDTLSVKIMPSLIGEPWITDIKEVGNGKLAISWETPMYQKENLKGYMVYTSKKYDGFYYPELKSLTDSDKKTVVLDPPNGFTYFRVGALDQFDRSYLSIPKLYQTTDSFPPSIPEGLTGYFDTSGVVNLKWRYGKEKDLLGYQILYSVNDNSEFSLVGKEFIFDSTYKKAFPTNMLSSNLYFKAVALDTRYNTSKASDPIKLVKPDKLPPSSPVIFLNRDSSDFAMAQISPSSSFDVKLHHLYYQPDTKNAEKIEVFKGSIKKDTNILLSNLNSAGYLICIAEDISGRKGYSNKLTFTPSHENLTESFKAAAIPKIDDGLVELHWEKNLIDGSLLIYRKDMVNGYRLIATVDSRIVVFRDRNVTVNTEYWYRLVVFPKNGKSFWKDLVVKYL